MTFEMLLIVGLFFLYAGGPTPGVNEAHYLAKAKHYWDPTWCAGDIFLGSADAHAVFYWTIGWLTLAMPLDAVAWTGRIAGWVLLAWSWQRLSWTLVPRRYVSILTAAWFIMLVDRFNLAGEWAVGGVEAKVFAYAFLLCGLRDLVLDRWRAVWLWLGAAAAFHVLVGGWAVIAAGFAWLRAARRPPLRVIVPPLIGGGVLALPGLLPAAWLTLGVDPKTVRAANQIYVFQRLSHHLVFHRFSTAHILYFTVLLLGWFGLSRHLAGQTRWQKLNLFAVGALMITVAGIAFDLALWSHPAAAAAVLRYYWFRLADITIPLATALAVPLALPSLKGEGKDETPGSKIKKSGNANDSVTECRRVARPAARAPFARDGGSRVARSVWVLAILIPCVFVVDRYWEQQRDFRPAAERQSRPDTRIGPWRAARQWRAWCDLGRWVQKNTPADTRFLTPRNQQTFKWYAQRSEVASWKDIPQDAEGIVPWWRTLETVYPARVARQGLGAWYDQQLVALAHQYHTAYIVVDRARSRRVIGLPRVYPGPHVRDPWFAIYQVQP